MRKKMIHRVAALMMVITLLLSGSNELRLTGSEIGEALTSLPTRTDKAILMNGAYYSVDDLTPLVFAADANLETIVSVDGQEFSLGDLKKMIEIDDAVNVLEESNALTPERRRIFDDLQTAFRTNSIELLTESIEPEYDDNLIINYDNVKTAANGDAQVSLSFTLSAAVTYPVSFDYRTLDGSAKSGENYTLSGGTITFAPGETTKTIAINLRTIAETDYARLWGGDKVFFVQYTNPANALFTGGTCAVSSKVAIQRAALATPPTWQLRASFNFTPYSTQGLNASFHVLNGTEHNKITLPITAYEKILAAQGNLRKLILKAFTTFDYQLNISLLAYIAGLGVVNPPASDKVFEYSGATNYPQNSIYTILDLTGDVDLKNKYLAGGQMMYYERQPLSPENTQQFYEMGLEIECASAANVVSITAPPGTYTAGETVPVVVEYSCMVYWPDYWGSGISTVGGDSLSRVEAGNSATRFVTYAYTVKPMDNATLTIDSFTNKGAIFMPPPYAWTSVGAGGPVTSTTLPGVILSTPHPFDAFTSVTTDKPAYYPITDEKIIVSVQYDPTRALWLDSDEIALGRVQVSYDGIPRTLTRVTNESGATIPGVLQTEISLTPADFWDNSQETTVSKKIRLYVDGQPVLGKFAQAVMNKAVLAESVTIRPESYAFPEGRIYLTQVDLPQLVAAYAPANATYTAVTWSSSDTNVASINQNGVVTPRGPGQVKFTATMTNGGLSTISHTVPENPNDYFIVEDGGPPMLAFPVGGREIYVKSGESALLAWVSNVHLKPGYDGSGYSVAIGRDAGVVFSGTGEANTYFTIPENILTEVSAGGIPSYTAVISAADPDGGAALTATANIFVLPQPVNARFVKPTNLFITDDAANFNFAWNVTNYSPAQDGFFRVKVVNNATDQPVFFGENAAAGGGTFNLRSVPADQLKDIYIATLEACNSVADTPTRDGFILWVYRSDAMKLMVDGVDKTNASIVMNHYDLQERSSEEILALNREISLSRRLGINHDEYAWSYNDDMIKWKAENTANAAEAPPATVNYRQGSLYDNIELFSYPQYPPGTDFMLAGLRDGTARVTAQHGKTGAQAELDVEVGTLKNKLYLFSIFPKINASATMRYTTGDGEDREIQTNDEGMAAVYEPGGIAGDVRLKATSGADTYFGTIAGRTLLSGEGDPSKLQLYPMNAFHMRKVSTVSFFFKKPDGTPYIGQVTYNAGVYKNETYCPAAELLNRSFNTGADGKFTLQMDATLFYTEAEAPATPLNPSDNLEFVCEVKFQNDTYYPRLLTFASNADEEAGAKFSLGVTELRTVPAGETEKPFIESQMIQVGRTMEEIIEYHGITGPGNHQPSVDLRTRVLWWGEETDEGWGVEIVDEDNVLLTTQRKKFSRLPFSTMALTENILTLTEHSGIATAETTTPQVILRLADGSLYKRVNSSFKLTNAIGVPDVMDDPTYQPLTVDTPTNMGGTPGGGDTLLTNGMSMLSGSGINTPFFKVLFLPTTDPYIFETIGLYDINMLNMDSSAMMNPTAEEAQGASPNASGILAGVLNYGKGATRMENLTNAFNSGKGSDKGGRAAGYFVGRTYLDKTTGVWKSRVIESGFTVGASFGYHWYFNNMVGPIPITAEIALGAAFELDLKQTDPRSPVPANSTARLNSDILTTLRLSAYVRGFAGFGFDYTIVALKIGLFGSINLTNFNQFLSREYLAETSLRQINGQYTRLDGTVGIEFIAKLLFINYRKVLASKTYNLGTWKTNRWDDIQTWVAAANLYPFGGAVTPMGRTLMRSLPVLEEVLSESVIEERAYLEKYDRTWGMGRRATRALDIQNALDNIQTNAYPYSNPKLTDDGGLLVFVSDADSADVNDTSIAYSKFDGVAYETPTILLPKTPGQPAPECNLHLAGSGNFAVAVWERLSHVIEKEAGEPINNADTLTMMNSTEIYAGVYDGGNWAAERLTDNEVADLAPACAANDEKAIVVWRRATGNSVDNPLQFNAQDSLVYRYYDGAFWGAETVLNNGANGSVKSISAAMDSAGNAIAAFIVDTGGVNGTGQEAFYVVIDEFGVAGKTVRRTSDDALDENLQAAALDLGGGRGENFLLAWHHVSDGEEGEVVHDIALQAVDYTGRIFDNFPGSLSEVTDNVSASLSAEFKLAKNESKALQGLAILWKAIVSDYSENPVMDTAAGASVAQDATALPDAVRERLWAVKFYEDNGHIGLTAPLDVAVMPDNTLIDSFDAYTRQDQPALKAAIASTTFDPNQLEPVEGQGIATPGRESHMRSATVLFENNFELSGVDYAYGDIRHSSDMPLQFTVFNSGIEAIEKLQLDFNGSPVNDYDTPIPPNSKAVITRFYRLPESGAPGALNYAINANFSNGDTKELTGVINLNVSDVGFASISTIAEENGERLIETHLVNTSDVSLAGLGATIKIGFYTDPSETEPAAVSLENGAQGDSTGADLVTSISAPVSIGLIDSQSLILRFRYVIPEDRLTDGKIPKEGISLYARAWIESQGDPVEEELNRKNNKISLVFDDPVARNNGVQFALDQTQTNTNGVTGVSVDLKNLAMSESDGGNILVSLLDENDEVLEVADYALENQSIEMDKEETKTFDFTFSREGFRTIAQYAQISQDQSDANLANLTLDGIKLPFDPNVSEYHVSASAIESTVVTAIAKGQDAQVSVNKSQAATGAAAVNVPLAVGETQIKITVSPLYGDSKLYTVYVTRQPETAEGDSSFDSGALYVQAADGWHKAPVVAKLNTNIVSDEITGFAYSIDNGVTFSNQEPWSANASFTVAGEGVHNVVGAVYNEKGYRVDSQTRLIHIDMTPPLAQASNVELRKTANGKSEIIVRDIFDALSGIAKVELKAGESLSASLTPIAEGNGWSAEFYPRSAFGSLLVYDAAGNKTTLSLNLTNFLPEPPNPQPFFPNRPGNTQVTPIPETSAAPVAPTAPVAPPAVSPDGAEDAFVNPFSDVNPSHWFYNDVIYVYTHGLFSGMTKDAFHPADPMRRGMMVTVLGRLYGADPARYNSSGFTDVKQNEYYAPYVTWARVMGIVSGMGQNQFAPNANISRQDFVVMLSRYEEATAGKLTVTRSADIFTDQSDVAGYAANAVRAFTASGLISGRGDGKFYPRSEITRAEAASILRRFVQTTPGHI